MKNQHAISLSARNMQQIIGFIFVLASFSVYAQQNDKCHDLVVLHDGSVFRGSVTEFNKGGNFEMTTWSGTVVRLPSSQVRSVKPKCVPKKQDTTYTKPYSFKERGWYYSPRLVAFLAPSNGMGLGMQYSVGFKFHRLLGAGIGIGIENLPPWSQNLKSVPVYGEVRGFLLANPTSPFYAIGAGWSIAPNVSHTVNADEEWKDGWMGHSQIGLRVGNHFIAYLGFRVHRNKIERASTWPINMKYPTLVKLIEVGLGLML